MRTVVENRYGVGRESECLDFGYVHLGQRPSRSRSCFYDLNKKKQVKFIECVDDDGSKFVRKLMEQII